MAEKSTDVERLRAVFNLGKKQFEQEPVTKPYDGVEGQKDVKPPVLTLENPPPEPPPAPAPGVEGAQAVYKFDEVAFGNLEQSAKEAIANERKNDQELRANFKQEDAVDVSLARLMDTINNTIIIAQREAMRSQDPDVLNTLVNAINASRQLLETTMNERREALRLRNAIELEKLKHEHKLELHRLRTAGLPPAKQAAAIGPGGTVNALTAGSGPVQINFNFQDEQKLRQQLTGRTMEELQRMQGTVCPGGINMEFADADPEAEKDPNINANA